MKKMLRSIGLGLLIAVLLLLVKNQFANRLPSSNYGMQTAIEMQTIDNLFIGSSMFRQGLEISVLERELPGNSYILSYNGNQPAFIAMELQYMLDHGVNVKNLYIDLYAYSAAANPWISDTKMLLDSDIQFKLDTWKLMRENNETNFLDFYELFVTANNEQLLTYPIHNALLAGQFHNGGSTLRPEGKTKEQLDSLEALGARDGIHPVQAEGYGKIIEIAEQNGINLVFLDTPKYERMLQDPDYEELIAACVDLVKSQGQTYIQASDLNFDFTEASYFQDLIHLSYEGRSTYTEMLCDYLR